MIIYPAIDILGGKCVRLTQGKYDDSTIYGDNPASIASGWQEKGAKWVHLVDLDGARTGKAINEEVISKIRKTVDVPLQVGGGIRNEAQIERYFKMGINRMILGTAAVSDLNFVKRMAEKYPIAVGIDAKDGKVAINGWNEVSAETSVEFAKKIEQCGVKTIIYTDIATDGMLSGPNLSAMAEMAKSVNMDVIASGGVGNIDDIKNLSLTGVHGVIIGRALYVGNVKLEDCLCLPNE